MRFLSQIFLSFSGGLALLEKAAAVFSDVTDSNDSSQFCVLTVKRNLGAGDRQGGK